MRIQTVNWKKDGRKYDDNVFHYTTPLGLFSILKNKCLRFTDCQFFNDKTEYIYIKKPLENALKKLSPMLSKNLLVESTENWLKDDYEYLSKRDKKLKERYYVFCSSMEDDSLNMWNYYLKDGKYQGYNIAISIEKILEYFSCVVPQNIELWHGPVIYSILDQEEELIQLIANIDRELIMLRKDVSYNDYWESFFQKAQEQIIDTIELYRLFFKDNSFKNEQEYRFVLKIPDVNIESEYFSYNFMVKNGVFVPYYDLSISSKIINSIKISPMIEEGIAKSGLSMFLKKYSCNNIEISQSKIPIRY